VANPGGRRRDSRYPARSSVPTVLFPYAARGPLVSSYPVAKRTLQVPDVLGSHLLALAEGKKSEELLFGYHDRNWPRKWVARICKAAGVPRVTAHGMRGLHGTLAVETGLSAHAVAAALGHESGRRLFRATPRQERGRALARTRS
jgi:integrase